MSIDKPRHEAFQAQSESVFVSQAMLEKQSKLLSFKKAMLFSKKDYFIIFCISFIVLVFFVAVISLKPLEFFHVASKWQLQAMAQESFHGTFLDNLKNFVLGQFSLGGKPMEELWRAAGWNSVFAFLFFIPQMIFAVFQTLFPLIFVFHFLLDRELKDMIQQLEKSPKQCDPMIP